jgi:hypothetical protein
MQQTSQIPGYCGVLKNQKLILKKKVLEDAPKELKMLHSVP